MTLQDLIRTDGDILQVDEVARYLRVAPQLLREQAHDDPTKLGFKVIVIGSRVLIPKAPFINFVRGPRQLIQVQDLKEDPTWSKLQASSL